MAVVEELADAAARTCCDLAGAFDCAHADILARNHRSLTDVSRGVEGVEGHLIPGSLADAFGCCSRASCGAFSDVSGSAADVSFRASGPAALRPLSLRSRFGLCRWLRRRSLRVLT